MNRTRGLAQALALAVSAPTAEQSKRALLLATNLAGAMSASQVKRAKALAVSYLREDVSDG